MSAKDIKKDLTELPHLQDLKEAVEDSIAEKPVKKSKQADPKDQEEYTFDFEWKNGSGKAWKGQFTNKILTIRERQLVGLLRARLAGGMPIEALDETTNDINLMVSHMSYSLVTKPDWAEDLTALTDVRLLTELYLEVLTHENHFCGYGSHKASS